MVDAPNENEPSREYVVTVDRSGGRKLGIDVAEGEELSDPLVVISIKEGLIDDWNHSNDQEVLCGHHLVEVNGVRANARELKNLCRSVTGPLRLVLRVPPDEVTGLHGALPACAEAKAVQAGSRAGEVMRRKLELLKSCWMCVTWFLYTHELLGKFARLSSAFAALLGDERCWQTLSLPKSPAMTQRLLKLMLVEEQELWAWPLCQVQQVDLDFTDAKHSTLEQLRTLLMKKLDVEDNLQRLILRNIPISAKPSEASYSPWDQNLIRLVNPVHPKYPAGFCSSFLVTDELGALRQRFRGFRFFLRPVRRDGEVQRALEVTALRGLAGTPWTQRSTARHPSDLEIGAKADELVEFELGELKDLPPCHSVVTDRFEDWKERMATSYKRMLALI